MKYHSPAKPIFPPVKKIRPAIQDWVLYLPPLVQSDLLKSLRGCDTMPFPDHSKFLVKEIRKVVTRNDRNNYSSNYFKYQGKLQEHLYKLKDYIEKYPMHFIVHLLEAVKIIAYTHPNQETRDKFAYIQLQLHKGQLTNPETPAEMKRRYKAKIRSTRMK